jgi:hypothetical protein
MTLLMPALPRPEATPPTTPADLRQVLAVVDLDAPVEPVVRRAVAESVAHAVRLEVIVLHPRLPFSTDPALVARMARRLGREQRRMVAAVTEAAQDHGSITFGVQLVPLSRIPLMSRSGKVRRTVAAQLRQQPSSLLVTAEHLRIGAGAKPSTREAGPSADLGELERSSV